MPHRRILNVLLMIALFSLFASASVSAADQYGWVNGRYRGPVPYYIGNPKNIPIDQKAPVAVAAQANVPVAPMPRDGSLHAYPYGYFGTQSRSYSFSFRNYYNDYLQTSYGRGY
jgi:hypothetical protein